MVGGPLAIIEDDDLEHAADRVRPILALYIGGMGARGVNFHFEVFARMGYEAEASKIQDLYLAGDKKSAIAAVPTKLVQDVALIGSWGQDHRRDPALEADHRDHLLRPLRPPPRWNIEPVITGPMEHRAGRPARAKYVSSEQ